MKFKKIFKYFNFLIIPSVLSSTISGVSKNYSIKNDFEDFKKNIYTEKLNLPIDEINHKIFDFMKENVSNLSINYEEDSFLFFVKKHNFWLNLKFIKN
ncbi:hypothetical protein [Mycoplasmopsis cricetuli]|uniref:hypothetical protein n=1 Tax=Mycoplasmopsis cricetuli TaxID=171283 RepID=UPI0004718E9F|nr:hypothetical protein [Mycoplasmopsis cricetuli]